ncbi:hypothetical protein [Streptomyces sp. KL116D]|uniref:MFS transporter n=1 Tax=Streptomyces sp. KL116D TaxID=3045152 RepID=UPI0035584B79
MGVAASLVMPGTLSILVDVFPEHTRPRALAVWGSASALGWPWGRCSAAPLWSHFWWGSVFLVNLLPSRRSPSLAAGSPVAAGRRRPCPGRWTPVGAVLGSAVMVAWCSAPSTPRATGGHRPPSWVRSAARWCAPPASWRGNGGTPARWSTSRCCAVPPSSARAPASCCSSAGSPARCSPSPSSFQFGLAYGPLKAGLALAPDRGRGRRGLVPRPVAGPSHRPARRASPPVWRPPRPAP